MPRAEGVQDGEWNALDAALVYESQADAKNKYDLSLPSSGIRALQAAAAATTEKKVEPFHLLGLTLAELKEFAAANGLPAFRGKQLREHLYGESRARSLDDLTTLPKAVRAQLAGAGVSVGRSVVHHVAQAQDGTAKLLLRLSDDRVVEAVGMALPSFTSELNLSISRTNS